MVLQAAVAGSDSAGVQQLTLPTNWATWRKIRMALWEGTANAIIFVTLYTDVMAVQAGTVAVARFLVGSSSSELSLRYTTNTRVLATNEAIDRIISAVLED